MVHALWAERLREVAGLFSIVSMCLKLRPAGGKKKAAEVTKVIYCNEELPLSVNVLE